MARQLFSIIFFCSTILNFTQATCVWMGDPAGDGWDDPANWSCGHVPTGVDDVIIEGGIVHVDKFVSVAKITLKGGTLADAGFDVTTPEFVWESGIIGVELSVGGGAVMHMVTGGTKVLAAKIFNFGDITWDAGAFELNGELINSSMFAIAFDGSIGYSSPMPGMITNSGSFNKVGGAGESIVAVPIMNTGAVGVTSGTMTCSSTATFSHKGTVMVDAGKLLNIHGDYTADPGAVFDGTGFIDFISGTTIIDVAYDGGLGFIFSGATVELKHDFFTTGGVGFAGGEVGGAGHLKSKTSMIWEEGILGVKTTIPVGATLAMSTAGTKTLKALLTTDGATTWSGGAFEMDGGTLINSGAFEETFPGILSQVAASTITNSGTFTKKTTLGTATIKVPFLNAVSGTVAVTLGKLLFDEAGLTNSGTVDISLAAELDLSHASSFTALSTLTGLGLLTLSEGEIGMGLTHSGLIYLKIDGAVVTFTGDFSTIRTITFLKGTIKGTKTLKVSNAGGSMIWKEGIIEGKVRIAPGAILYMSGTEDKAITNGTLTNDGTVSWTEGDFVISGSGKLINNSTFRCLFNGWLTYYISSGIGSVSNTGTFNVNTTGWMSLDVDFTNSGTLKIDNGSFYINSGDFSNSSTISFVLNSLIEIDTDVDFNLGTVISGAGAFKLTGGTWDIKETLSLSNAFTITGGSFELSNSLSTSGTFAMSGGLLTGGSTLTLLNSLAWSGGTIGAAVTMDGAATVGITGGLKTLTGTFSQAGTGTWSAGNIIIESPGVFNNSGTMEMSGPDSLKFTTTTGTFNNSGTFSKTGSNRAVFLVDFTNTGTMNGIGIAEPIGTFTNTSGTIAPGNSPGILTYDGSFTNGTMLDIELFDGSGAGTGHDQLVVTGDAMLGGTIKVVETGSVPNGSYTILICQGGPACRTGSFSTIDLPTDYVLSMTGTEVIVTKSALPVELVEFEAEKEDRDILLSWETASEQNNDYFTIERSFNGKDFDPIEEILGQGTTTVSHHYSFLDVGIYEIAKSTIIYYRLRQTDFDGANKLSKVVAVEMDKEASIFEIENVRRDDAGFIAVRFNDNKEMNGLSLFLSDRSGRTISQEKINLENGQVARLNTGLLPAGIYFIAAKWQDKYSSYRVFLGE